MAPRLVVEVVGNTKGLTKALGQSEVALNRFGKTASKVGLSGGALGLTKGTLATAGVGAGLLGLKSVLDASKNAQVILGQTSVAVQDAGLSWAKYGQQVQQASLNIAKSSAFDDEAVLQSFAVFVRGQKDVGKSLVLSGLAADVARGRYTDLASGTQLVNKAALGQIGALRRAGIFIDKNATATEALTALTKAYGGAAVRYANTAAGAQDKLRVSYENLREAAGSKLLPVVTKGILILDRSSDGYKLLGHDLGTVYRQFTRLTDALGATNSKFVYGQKVIAGYMAAAAGLRGPVGAKPFSGPLPPGLQGTRGSRAAAVTQLPNRVVSQELDARLSGNNARLRATLVQEEKALRSALKDPRLKIGQRVALKNELLGIVSEIQGMDDEMAQAAKDKKNAAADARAKARAAAKAAKAKLAAANKALIQQFKDQADAIKSAVLDAFDTKTNKIQNARALEDAKAALRVARQIGGPQGIKLATRDLTDAQRAVQRQRIEDTTFRVGQGPAGPVNKVSVGTQNFYITTSDPDKAAREVVKLMGWKTGAGAPQARGRRPGRQAY